jgi:hypothetical protein
MARHLVTNQGSSLALQMGLVDYIVGSPIVWQVATQLEMIVNDTHYYAMGGNFDHKLLRLRLSIDCSFVEP